MADLAASSDSNLVSQIQPTLMAHDVSVISTPYIVRGTNCEFLLKRGWKQFSLASGNDAEAGGHI